MDLYDSKMWVGLSVWRRKTWACASTNITDAEDGSPSKVPVGYVLQRISNVREWKSRVVVGMSDLSMLDCDLRDT